MDSEPGECLSCLVPATVLIIGLYLTDCHHFTFALQAKILRMGYDALGAIRVLRDGLSPERPHTFVQADALVRSPSPCCNSHPLKRQMLMLAGVVCYLVGVRARVDITGAERVWGGGADVLEDDGVEFLVRPICSPPLHYCFLPTSPIFHHIIHSEFIPTDHGLFFWLLVSHYLWRLQESRNVLLHCRWMSMVARPVRRSPKVAGRDHRTTRQEEDWREGSADGSAHQEEV